jgi:uncharacterized protein with HEPN domain
MTRKVAPVLDEILKAIDGIQSAIREKTLDDFERDWLLNHGVQRGLEIIFEASRHLPAELKSKQPQIRWASIAGIGNILRHRYHEVSNDIVWKVVQDDLPPLRIAIEAFIASIERE